MWIERFFHPVTNGQIYNFVSLSKINRKMYLASKFLISIGRVEFLLKFVHQEIMKIKISKDSISLTKWLFDGVRSRKCFFKIKVYEWEYFVSSIYKVIHNHVKNF